MKLSARATIGPIPIGVLQPEVLQEILRRLRPGELSAPRQIGEWHVLMRLEQLNLHGLTRPCVNRCSRKRSDAFLEIE